jgi:hypothetical protein
MRRNYEKEKGEFPGAYAVKGWGKGIAWRVLGWETEPDDDTEWTGIENRTGRIVAVMIGDDRHFSVDPDDVKAIEEGSYCPECGQIGCGCYR